MLPPLSTLLAFATVVHSEYILFDRPTAAPTVTNLTSTYLAPPKEDCPPCFNCLLPAFKCLQYGGCSEFNGRCQCPEGWGGEDCSTPLCGSLAEGRDRFPRKGEECHCTDGWTGMNCNVCKTNDACSLMLPLPDEGAQDEDEAVCYSGGILVNQVHQMCDVTNRKILDQLGPGKPPQVTFTCDFPSATCGFQFWIGKKESFYCGLNNCTSSTQLDENGDVTYRCENIECSCIPGRMLCGEAGSVDIGDFLTEEIKGPAKFSYSYVNEGKAKFEEPAMNQLINDIFGDEFITLSCQSGECIRKALLPGIVIPKPKYNSLLVWISMGVSFLVVILASLLFWYLGRANSSDYNNGAIRLPAEENAKLISDHVASSLFFSNLRYSIPSRESPIIEKVTGGVHPGQIMAIMGASGAGKSTLLDILARRGKRGDVSGDVLVNGKDLRRMGREKFARLVGFVDQEDTLLGTLTVYETVLYSALLRLPRGMSLEAKKIRTLETLHELGILGIRDSRIGESGQRAISGGEKRRVSIACELVTSPSILMLDEPTSGLDSYNALNVVECLVTLAKKYNRTVIFTIHQPRSNIVAMFDQLVLLAKGRVVYSGEFKRCQEYFERIGYPCPAGFNIADYLIDLTMQEELQAQAQSEPDLASIVSQLPSSRASYSDEESSLAHGIGTDSNRTAVGGSGSGSETGETETSTPEATSTSRNSLGVGKKGKKSSLERLMSERMTELLKNYESSQIAKGIEEEIENSKRILRRESFEDQNEKRTGWMRATLWTQFRILSGRAFKNLYRNPALMLTQYLISVILALICSFLFHNLTQDIPGFQNRMGLFFFILTLFGFSCLTSLRTFANERILFMRERANGYYSPVTYFTAKVLFDLLPLRIVPPFILGAIIYKPVGLVPMLAEFWKFILILILFNLVASSSIMLIGIAVKNESVASLIGTLSMLFNLLFAGLLINSEKMPRGFGWLQTISYFHAGMEGLLVNELRYLHLRDHRYGVDIEVPAATILSMFGFNAQAFWFPDTTVLVVFFAFFILASFLALVVLVKERR